MGVRGLLVIVMVCKYELGGGCNFSDVSRERNGFVYYAEKAAPCMYGRQRPVSASKVLVYRIF